MISPVAGIVAELVTAAAVLLSNGAQPPEEAETETIPVVCEGTLPFSRVELEEALRPRWHLLARPLAQPVRVREQEGDRVSIEVGAGRREVVLRGQSGETAARIVALLTVDLVTDRAVAEGSHATTGTSVWGASTELLVPFVANGWTPTLEPTIRFERRVARRATVGVSVGFTSLSAGEATSSLRLREVPVRAGVGYAGAWFDLRASGVARPYFVSGVGDDEGVRWGASVSASIYRPLGPRLALAVSAGLDGFRNRKLFRVDGPPVIETSWVVPWLGVGVALRSAP